MKFSLKQVSKVYNGKVKALERITLELQEKRIGILGEQGSGKTSLANILATVTNPTEGSILFNGTDLRESREDVRSVLGYLPQHFGAYGTLTAQEYLKYLAIIKGVDRSIINDTIQSLLVKVNYTEQDRTLLGSLATGARQRIGLAQLFLSNPGLIIVDELSSDLSSEERQEMLEFLKNQTRNRFLIFASEEADDFQGMIDELVILNQGKLVLQTTPEEFLKLVEDKVWEITMGSVTLSSVRKRYFTTKMEYIREGIRLRCISETQPSQAAVKVPAMLNDAYRYYLSELTKEKQ